MIRLNELDYLPFFEASDFIVIQQACEVKNKAIDLLDSLEDNSPVSWLALALDSILTYLVDASQFFADAVSERVGFEIHEFACCRSRFCEWYQNLDDLIRHSKVCHYIRVTGFAYRSLYFSCCSLAQVLSQYISDWLELHPDIDIRSFPRDWSKTSFEPVPPNLDIDFDPAHYII